MCANSAYHLCPPFVAKNVFLGGTLLASRTGVDHPQYRSEPRPTLGKSEKEDDSLKDARTGTRCRSSSATRQITQLWLPEDVT
jgi:hypothetical protein